MRRVLPVVFLLLATAFAAYAQNYREVAAADLKKMIDGKKRMVLIDARTEEEYRQGHIPTSVSLPPEKVGQIVGILPKNKKVPIVIYCRGVG